MRNVVRKQVWETNSSSVHTVTIDNTPDMIYEAANPVIEVTIGEYGWDGDPLVFFKEKLAYAMAMVLNTEYPGFYAYDEDFEINQDVLEELPGYQTLINAIRLHQDCDKIVINKNKHSYYPYGYIDHQSYEDYTSLQDFLDDWGIDAERFLFDNGVTVWIDNDNH